MHYESRVGHIGGNLSALDVLMAVHHRAMEKDDVFVLSKGHAAGALYVTLWTLGHLTEEDLCQFHKDRTKLSGHPAPNWIPQIPFAKRAVRSMLQFPERDLFLRGVQAFVDFKQAGIDYVRPERMFGRSTNSLAKNLAWAKKGILSFSNTPLSILSFAGTVLFLVTVLLMIVQTLARLFFPQLTPPGVTMMLLAIMFFGSINLFGLGIIAEYIGKIFEETKQRPLFIRRNIIRDGAVRNAAEGP